MVYYGLLQHKNCRTKLSILTQHNCMAWFVCPISQQLGPRPAVWSLLLLGIDHTVGSLVQSWSSGGTGLRLSYGSSLTLVTTLNWKFIGMDRSRIDFTDWLVMTCDDLWWLVMTCDDLWWLVMTCGLSRLILLIMYRHGTVRFRPVVPLCHHRLNMFEPGLVCTGISGYFTKSAWHV